MKNSKNKIKQHLELREFIFLMVDCNCKNEQIFFSALKIYNQTIFFWVKHVSAWLGHAMWWKT